MRLLLDTHVFLWWSAGSPRLKARPKKAISEASEIFVSAASAWEAAIKSSLGKLRMDVPFEDAIELNQFSKLPVLFAHAAALVELPSHHNDPFDRMIIAQARTEKLTVVTHDVLFRPYDLAILWV